MVNHTAEQVAEWFLNYNRAKEEEGAERITNLKLQILLYYAQGTFLSATGSPLFNDKIKAWTSGPAIEDIELKYLLYKTDGIPYNGFFNPSIFTAEENSLLASVYKEYGQYSAWKLREMAKSESPWKDTPLSQTIPQSAIKEYFEENK